MADGDAPTAPDPGAPDQPHEESGLDLARRLTRATAAGKVPPARSSNRPRSSHDARAAARRAGPQLSGAHPDDRDPQLLAGEVGRLVGQQGWELSLRMRGVFARWREIVGEEIADHTTPETFVEGRLVVRTDSTAWATQLTLLAPDLLRRLNEELGHGTVAVIDVQGPHGPSWKRGRLSARDGRGPRDTYG